MGLLLGGGGRKEKERKKKKSQGKAEEKKLTKQKATLCEMKDMDTSLTLCLGGRLTFE